MKKLLILSFSILFCMAIHAQDVYNLVFSDEFDGTTLDLSKWNIQSGYAANQEKEYYTAGNNIRLENGNLVITGKKEQAVTDRNYSSGRINSQSKGYVKYGKIEARISVPSGAGTWPAFWMMPQTNVYGGWPKSGEIDIMEHIGSDHRMTSHAVHTANKNGSLGNNWFNRQYKDSMENKFHVYSVVWGPDDMKFYIDSIKSVTLYRNFTEDYKGWPFDQPFYVILNLALGGTMGGTINDAIFDAPVEMKVDYVRVYQKAITAVSNPFDNHIQVFPTCFTNEIKVNTINPIQVMLYDSVGTLLLTRQMNGNETINSNNSPGGIYLLKAGEKTFKLIKE